MQYFDSIEPLELESGARLDNVRLAYHTYGSLNARRDNVVWVCHALTANSDVADWWPGTVVEGGLLDPARYFVVCANKLGSCYGSTRGRFTIRDNVRAFAMLANALGVNKIHRLVGGSTGGMQAMEWAVMEPERIENLVLLATLPRADAWIVANSQAQRMAIGNTGNIAAARAIAMLFYRNATAYNATQTPQSVVTYQEYQGKKLADRFDKDCYLDMLYTLDGHDVSRGRSSLEQALGAIKAKTICIGIDSDIMFRPADVRAMSDMIPQSRYVEIHSDFGHDGFLIETQTISEIVLSGE